MRQTVKYHLSGVCPLLMHNGQLADPLNYWTKEIKKISGKRMKTEADQEEIARLEWHGSLYLDNGRPCVPGFAMDATLINAAKKHKKGMQAKAGLICEGNFPIEYHGPESIEQLWNDERFRRRVLMKVKNAGVMRTQPLFYPWECIVIIAYSDELLNRSDIDQFMSIAGESIGLLEGRPRFGRFNMQVL